AYVDRECGHGGLLPLTLDRPVTSEEHQAVVRTLLAVHAHPDDAPSTRARPPWPATPTRACGWWWSPAPAARPARSSTRPWTSRGCWSGCPSCAARSWPRPWRSWTSPPTTGSATATRAWPTATPTATP